MEKGASTDRSLGESNATWVVNDARRRVEFERYRTVARHLEARMHGGAIVVPMIAREAHRATTYSTMITRPISPPGPRRSHSRRTSANPSMQTSY